MQFCQSHPVLWHTCSSYSPRAGRRVHCDALQVPLTFCIRAVWAGWGELPSPMAPAVAAPQAHPAAAPSPKHRGPMHWDKNQDLCERPHSGKT